MFYKALLHSHSILRWLLVLIALAAIIINARGVLTKATWSPTNRKLNAALLGTTHLQVLIGLLLYVGVSPLMSSIFNDFGAAMKNPVLRFWAVEHIAMMILAAVVIHITHVMVKKSELDAQKFKRGLIGFSLGVLIMMAAIPWPFRSALGRGWMPF